MESVSQVSKIDTSTQAVSNARTMREFQPSVQVPICNRSTVRLVPSYRDLGI
jgi:hypothetical protein